jgi:ectoine hydroxylase-related dioxygenase (phytanoyl-CoA dioxygenase family)
MIEPTIVRADPALLAEIAQRGYTVVPNALTSDEVSVLRESLERCVFEDLEQWKGRDYPDAWMVHNLMVRGRPFEQLLENPTMHAYLSEVLDDKCIVYAYTSSSLPSGGANRSFRIHNDSPRVIPGYVTNVGVIFALDDFIAENGATYYLPGSQWRLDEPSSDEFYQNAQRVFPKAGDAVIFNARTWHSSAPNTTDRHRHAITFNVVRSYMRQRFDYPRLVPPSVVERLGETGRRFLGFNVRMPSSLEEYYVPPDQRLYKNGQG